MIESPTVPDIKVEFGRGNGFHNLVEDGFDAGVRLGETVEKDMAAVRIGPYWRLVAVGAPGYFAARGIPRTLQDMVNHKRTFVPVRLIVLL